MKTLILLATTALFFSGCTTAINTEVSYMPATGEVIYRSEKDVIFERSADGSIRLKAVASAPELARTEREVTQQRTMHSLIQALSTQLSEE